MYMALLASSGYIIQLHIKNADVPSWSCSFNISFQGVGDFTVRFAADGERFSLAVTPASLVVPGHYTIAHQSTESVLGTTLYGAIDFQDQP
jgi:hypothetical protein